MNRSLMNGTTAQNEFYKDKIHHSHEISIEEKTPKHVPYMLIIKLT